MYHLIVFASLLLPALTLAQGLVWETTTSIPGMSDVKMDTKSSYLPRMFRQGSETEAVIFRLDKRMMYSIDYAGKKYSEITFAELETLLAKTGDRMKGQMEELKKEMASLPEDQRKLMEQMTGPGAGAGADAKVMVTKSGETKSISGFKCTKYDLKRGPEAVATIWTTSTLPDFVAMQKDFSEFSRLLASQMSTGGLRMAEALSKVEGFPVQTTIAGMTATVTRAEKAAVAKEEFEIPPGFTKVPFESMRRHRGGRSDETQMGDPRN